MANEGVIIKQKTFYPKDVLKNFEKEIGNTKFYYDFLIEKGVWVVNEYHPHGAVKDPEKYAQLVEEFDALQDLVFARQKAQKQEQEEIKSNEIDVNKIPF